MQQIKIKIYLKKRLAAITAIVPNEKFVENYLSIVNEEIDRLNKIIVDFLFAARPISMEIETVNLNKSLEGYLSFIMPELEKKKISINTNFGNNIPDLLLDSKLLKQVFINFGVFNYYSNILVFRFVCNWKKFRS